MKTEFARLAREAIATSDFKAFGDTLATQALPDSFGVLVDPDLMKLIADHLQDSDPTKWVTRPLTWNAELYDPDVTLNPEDQLLHLLWQDLNTRLVPKLQSVARRRPLPFRGVVLCFF